MENASAALEAAAEDVVGTLDVNEADVWAAFDAAMGLPEDCRGAMTRAELAEHYGISKDTAQKLAERAIAEGRMAQTQKRARNGHFVPAYLPIEETNDGD